MAEAIVGLHKNGCVKIDGPFRAVDELKSFTLDWVCWYNETVCTPRSDLIPTEFKQQYREMNPHPQPPLA